MADPVVARPGSIPAMSAVEIRDRIAAGELSACEVTEACLDRISQAEPTIRAWAWLDPDYARVQARALDARRAAGKPLGALHGVPVGLKDIIDTQDIPTEYGCAITAGHVPDADAAVVERLKSAGAVILGKTVTTELAFMHPGPTRNPANPEHTPGGSSSGSAAAVAAGMVPLAVGTQTGGSVIRPAAYCGIVGYKPSFGMIPRRGVLTQSPALDTVGVFAQDIAGAALIVDVLAGYDPGDRATRPAPAPRLLEFLNGRDLHPARLAFVDLPGVPPAEAGVVSLLGGRLAAQLGARMERQALPKAFDQVAELRECINFVEMARHYAELEEKGAEALSEPTRKAMRAGKRALATDYLRALESIDALNESLRTLFGAFDAIVSQATDGPAPKGLQSTGTAICNGVWTLCGTPTLTVPLPASMRGELPKGVQITTPRGEDARLLGIGARVASALSSPATEGC